MHSHNAQLHAVQQKLESGCEDIRKSDSFFPELLARFSSQSVRDEVQALITATESFRGDPFLSLIPNECSYSISIELLPTTVDCIVSLSDEDISNLFVVVSILPQCWGNDHRITSLHSVQANPNAIFCPHFLQTCTV